jgi:hypothetical protein
LSSELDQLTGLKHFLVNDNQLAGSVPIQWNNGLTSSLKVFWFHGNDLTGSIDAVYCHLKDDPLR